MKYNFILYSQLYILTIFSLHNLRDFITIFLENSVEKRNKYLMTVAVDDFYLVANSVGVKKYFFYIYIFIIYAM